ncbi:MAG: Gfo/Idh/MocA family oxidoreductase [Streptosporangiales bacterium]|nr:Gfo/Idh/MocA family oxidoreductase [Streptosporangiales bacterium]MBO0892265.1 Gfo/Idh/MocA family oxidoreductase [Acidothermales bacterium]
MKLGLAGAGRIGAMHAAKLAALPGVDAVLVADTDAARAESVAARVGGRVRAVPRVDDLFTGDVDGLVIAAATDAHAVLAVRAARAGIPVLCEKPMATDVAGGCEVIAVDDEVDVPIRVGFQRRFDPGYVAGREALRSGRLGYLHTIRATTLDPAPPPAAYIAWSGGIFRDCGVHDFDAIRWVTGREVVEVYATGANRGAGFFAEAGDVDTAAALLTLDDGTLAVVSLGRYNGAGYDVRLELLGERDSVVVGLDDRVPLRSAEPGVAWPDGVPATGFPVRFAAAYRAELEAFAAVAAGKPADSVALCTPREALAAFLVAEACERSRAERRPVRLDEVG